MVNAILGLVGVAGVAIGGGVGYLAMKGKLSSVEAELKSHISLAVASLEGFASKAEADVKTEAANLAAFLKSKL